MVRVFFLLVKFVLIQFFFCIFLKYFYCYFWVWIGQLKLHNFSLVLLTPYHLMCWNVLIWNFTNDGYWTCDIHPAFPRHALMNWHDILLFESPKIIKWYWDISFFSTFIHILHVFCLMLFSAGVFILRFHFFLLCLRKKKGWESLANACYSDVMSQFPELKNCTYICMQYIQRKRTVIISPQMLKKSFSFRVKSSGYLHTCTCNLFNEMFGFSGPCWNVYCPPIHILFL